MNLGTCTVSLESLEYLLEDAAAYFYRDIKKAFCILHGKKAIAAQVYVRNGLKLANDGIYTGIAQCFPICGECIRVYPPLESLQKHLQARELPDKVSTVDDYIKGFISVDERAVSFAMNESPYRTEGLKNEALIRVNTHLN